jgi:hypothetical protein
MDMFPKMLYRFPAQARDSVALQDGTYDVLRVVSEAEQADCLAEGWFEAPADAKAAFAEKLAATEAAAKAEAEAATLAASNQGPTREELEAKATELGLKFDGRTSDKKLSEAILEKLKAA